MSSSASTSTFSSRDVLAWTCSAAAAGASAIVISKALKNEKAAVGVSAVVGGICFFGVLRSIVSKKTRSWSVLKKIGASIPGMVLSTAISYVCKERDAKEAMKVCAKVTGSVACACVIIRADRD
jgi:ABC-type enterobactin transport system permease subunit